MSVESEDGIQLREHVDLLLSLPSAPRSAPFLVNERSVCVRLGLSWIPLVLPNLSCLGHFSFIPSPAVELFPFGSSVGIP